LQANVYRYEGGGDHMKATEKKAFVKPELIKFDKPLEEVTKHFSYQTGSGGCTKNSNYFWWWHK
jgi:hypothetical protein